MTPFIREWIDYFYVMPLYPFHIFQQVYSAIEGDEVMTIKDIVEQYDYNVSTHFVINNFFDAREFPLLIQTYFPIYSISVCAFFDCNAISWLLPYYLPTFSKHGQLILFSVSSLELSSFRHDHRDFLNEFYAMLQDLQKK